MGTLNARSLTHTGKQSVSFNEGDVLRANIYSGKVIDYGEAEDKNKLLALAGMALRLADIPSDLNPYVAREMGIENVKRVRRNIRELCEFARSDMRRRLDDATLAPSGLGARLTWSSQTNEEYLDHVKAQIRTAALKHSLSDDTLAAFLDAAMQAVLIEFQDRSFPAPALASAHSGAAAAESDEDDDDDEPAAAAAASPTRD